MRLARSAGKPLLFEEFGTQRDYLNPPSTGRNTVIARSAPGLLLAYETVEASAAPSRADGRAERCCSGGHHGNGPSDVSARLHRGDQKAVLADYASSLRPLQSCERASLFAVHHQCRLCCAAVCCQRQMRMGTRAPWCGSCMPHSETTTTMTSTTSECLSVVHFCGVTGVRVVRHVCLAAIINDR